MLVFLRKVGVLVKHQFEMTRLLTLSYFLLTTGYAMCLELDPALASSFRKAIDSASLVIVADVENVGSLYNGLVALGQPVQYLKVKQNQSTYPIVCGSDVIGPTF